MICLEEEIHIYYILYDLFDLEPPMLRTSHLLLHELIQSPGHFQLMVNIISGKIQLMQGVIINFRFVGTHNLCQEFRLR